MKYKCNSYLDSYEYGKMALAFPSKMWISFSMYASVYNLVLCVIIFLLSKNIIDTVGTFIIIEVVILILFRLKIREVAKFFYRLYLKNKLESNVELEFYEDYFVRRGNNTLEEKYSDIDICVETDTNLYLQDNKKDIIFVIQKNECELDLINFLRNNLSNWESRLGGRINFKNR